LNSLIDQEKKYAIIAGSGSLPLAIARELHKKGKSPLVLMLMRQDPELLPFAREIFPMTEIDMEKILYLLKEREITDLVFAGKVPKELIFSPQKLDCRTLALLSSLDSRDDHSILGAIVREFETAGFSVRAYLDILPGLLASEGLMSSRAPNVRENEDIEYALSIMKVILPLSFGQSLVVSGRCVVAVEAMEGTDRTVLRAGELCDGGVLVKMMRSDQDPRYDIPTVGLDTLEAMHTAGLSCLAVEVGRTLILDRKAFLSRADKYGIAVVGVDNCPSS